MKLNKFKYTTLLFAGLALASCENEVDLDQSPTNGTADFSNYVAIGNSLTAGISDGGLYAEAQSQSFPAQLSMRMAEVDPSVGTFTQPDVSGTGSGYITLEDLQGTTPVLGQAPGDASFAQKAAVAGNGYNNMGVPGIRALDITVDGYGVQQANPYFWRMLADGTEPTTSYLEAVAATDPTFFTCWMGNNDVLGYATSGGVAGVEGEPGTFLNGITPTDLFAASYQGLIATLTADGTTKGVVATIPNIADIPYFTTAPSAPIILLDEANAAQLNAGYDAEFNAGVLAWNQAVTVQGLPESLLRETINFEAGNNFPVIVDESLSEVLLPIGPGGSLVEIPKWRKMRPGELFPLTLLAIQDQFLSGLGTQTALGSQYVLTESELANIATAIEEFNVVIRSIASSNPNVALWDANADFADVTANGYSLNGVSIDGRFILGGAFSLDGIHPTPRGYAWVANSFINTINSNFNATIEPISIGQYRGVLFP